VTGPSPEFVPGTGELLYERRGSVALLTFNRPQARNAMTWAMYEGLYRACEHVDADDRVRVLVLRGAGDRAFVAGTDIGQFRSFSTPKDALDYEREGNRYPDRLESLGKPTIAVLRGFCAGGGAGIAMACDFRLAAPDVRFGVPIAKTLGNTLSMAALTRLLALVGPARAKDILFRARFVEAEEGKAAGLFNEVVPGDGLEARALELADELAGNAPLTIRSLKESIRRLVAAQRLPEAEELILMCYQSADFREGVSAFLEKRSPRWTGS
jgi:enoyl-CoA hydratase